ncbi:MULTISPECIES: VWA domain-containing protein [unclassified Colwellia]|jgi:Ca-activated chloride channel family protein|uniref:vWA domain-containing protein n=1 Tax=unclassified Colwellia TaxID=196834 RepID=UPI0015F3BE9D|nr:MULTISPECIES: VWA domain-containing protein [unclassified Colwellia]MBA6251435.1 VWA domain-containing protein [Colwellia sp. MB3u-55]MBA6397892.1 VWA domain-containing protein [Colwellia sp. BRX10-4]
MINLLLPWVLLALPIPLLMYLLPAKNQNQAAALKMPILIQNASSQSFSAKTKKSPRILFLLIWSLIVLSASQPQWLGEAVNVPTEGREMMIAVDLSGSMQVEDMQINGSTVNRLDMLKVLLGEFIERRTGDRLGLILFGDDAYMQTPMTFDRKTVQQMLDEAVLGLVGKQTAIGDAIALAVKRFDAKKQSNRVLLLLTDGQNTAGKITPEQALELAVAKNITIYSVGIGADVMIQDSIFGKRRINPSSELDEESLQQLASETGGYYFRARDSKDMSEIYQLLDALEPIEQDQQQMRPLTALFYWPLSTALLLSFFYLIWVNLPTITLKGANN